MQDECKINAKIQREQKLQSQLKSPASSAQSAKRHADALIGQFRHGSRELVSGSDVARDVAQLILIRTGNGYSPLASVDARDLRVVRGCSQLRNKASPDRAAAPNNDSVRRRGEFAHSAAVMSEHHRMRLKTLGALFCYRRYRRDFAEIKASSCETCMLG